MSDEYLSVDVDVEWSKVDVTVDDPEIKVSLAEDDSEILVTLAGSSIPDGPSIVTAIDTELGSSVWQSPGAAGSTPYVHTQASAALTWTITHGLGYYPNVMAFDGSGVEIRGTVDHVSINEVQITHSTAYSGVAYLS